MTELSTVGGGHTALDSWSKDDVWVLVPVFNEGPVIEGVVGSLVRQYPNVVVIDDGSTDDTRAVLERVAVTVLHHVVNLGQGAALQTGR